MPTREEIVGFLQGRNALAGHWFGDRRPGLPTYWWRGYLPGLIAPIPMVLHCPKCHAQHIDTSDEANGWNNPPHRSHLCGSCGCIWRPADVATVGVATVETKGSADNWEPPVVRGSGREPYVEAWGSKYAPLAAMRPGRVSDGGKLIGDSLHAPVQWPLQLPAGFAPTGAHTAGPANERGQGPAVYYEAPSLAELEQRRAARLGGDANATIIDTHNSHDDEFPCGPA